LLRFGRKACPTSHQERISHDEDTRRAVKLWSNPRGFCTPPQTCVLIMRHTGLMCCRTELAVLEVEPAPRATGGGGSPRRRSVNSSPSGRFVPRPLPAPPPGSMKVTAALRASHANPSGVIILPSCLAVGRGRGWSGSLPRNLTVGRGIGADPLTDTRPLRERRQFCLS
jgi:hypothetical protein